MLTTGFYEEDKASLIRAALSSVSNKNVNNEIKCFNVQINSMPFNEDTEMFAYVMNSKREPITAQEKCTNINNPIYLPFCIPKFDSSMKLVFQLYSIIKTDTLLKKMTYCGVSDIKEGVVDLFPIDLSKAKGKSVDDILETRNNKKEPLKIPIKVHFIDYDSNIQFNCIQQYQMPQLYNDSKSLFSFFPTYLENVSKSILKKEQQVRAYLIDKVNSVKEYEKYKPFYNSSTQKNPFLFVEEMVQLKKNFDCNILVVVGNPAIFFGTFSLKNATNKVSINLIKASKAIKTTVDELESMNSDSKLITNIKILSSVFKTQKIKDILSKNVDESMRIIRNMSNNEVFPYIPEIIQKFSIEETAKTIELKLFENNFGEDLLVNELIKRNIIITNESILKMDKPPCFIIKLWYKSIKTIGEEEIEIMKHLVCSSDDCAKYLGITLSSDIANLSTDIIDSILESSQAMTKSRFVTALISSKDEKIPALIAKHFPEIAQFNLNSIISLINYIQLENFLPLAISLFSTPLMLLKEIGSKILFVFYAAFHKPLNITSLTRKELFGSVLWAEECLKMNGNQKYFYNMLISVVNYALNISDPIKNIVIDKSLYLIHDLPFKEKKLEILNILLDNNFASMEMIRNALQIIEEDNENIETNVKTLAKILSKVAINENNRFVQEISLSSLTLEKRIIFQNIIKSNTSFIFS